MRLRLLPIITILLAAASTRPAQAGADYERLTLTPLGQRTEIAGDAADPRGIAGLEQKVADQPRERMHRFHLARALMQHGDLQAALEVARAWRSIDAYNLVVVRMIGDIQSRMGARAAARRSYSAVAELLPDDPEAQRAVATVLATEGDLEAAYARLEVAHELRPDDRRLQFELADVALRAGQAERARGLLEVLAADEAAPQAIGHPAKQRLAQIYAGLRRRALADARSDEAQAWTARIAALDLAGGVDNDIKIYLSWDTDRTDIDLWVTTPAKETIKYSHRRGKHGGELFHDVTAGYGPESFTAKRAIAGRYLVTVHYYGGQRTNFVEARGRVTVVLDEGRSNERQFVLPYTIMQRRQWLEVAAITVGNEKVQ